MKIRAIQRVTGALTAASAGVIVPSLLLAWWWDESTEAMFARCLAATLVLGLGLWYPARHAHDELGVREGFLVTTIAWLLVSATCALPFLWGPTHLSLADAVFESVSGLTTTGATVLSGLDQLPRSVLFYRQSLNFLGGVGIIILAVAILPMLRVGGSQLFRAETTGPVKDNKLTPRVAETARALWRVYLGLNIACAVAYWIGGMPWFDAVCHAFSTVATGGFSIHDQSLGYYHSTLIENIAMLFMFLGGINYALHYRAWRRASLDGYFADAEVKAYFAITLGLAVVVAIGVYANGNYDTLAAAFHEGLFQTVSNLSTTGLTTHSYANWGSFVPMLLIMMGFVGGCSGSTAGGMKVARVVMLFRQGAREIQQLIHPKGRFVVKLGGISVTGAVLAAVTGFCTLYCFSYVVMALALSASGVDWVTAWSAVAVCINNMGPGLDGIAERFHNFNDASIWVCSFAMILGRLEVFTVLVLFSPTFWRE
jgi:trk system potassium uptake protein TrkH